MADSSGVYDIEGYAEPAGFTFGSFKATAKIGPVGQPGRYGLTLEIALLLMIVS